MVYENFNDCIVVRLERGEELVSSVRRVCETEMVRLAHITGIGAVGRAVLGLYHVRERRFSSRTLEGEYELVSLLGNVTTDGGAPYLHLHASLADEAGHMTGGHLSEATVSGTAEIFIVRLVGTVERVREEATGLQMMDFPGLFHMV